MWPANPLKHPKHAPLHRFGSDNQEARRWITDPQGKHITDHVRGDAAMQGFTCWVQELGEDEMDVDGERCRGEGL